MSREAIQRLVEDDPFPAILGDAGGWSRSYGRIDAQGHAVLLYDSTQGPRDIRAVITGTGKDTVKDIGNYAVAHWSADQALPELRSLGQRHAGIVPIRYRPGKRCTLRLPRGAGLFVKALADERGDAIHRVSLLLWRACKDGQLGFAVARPAGWLPGMRMLVHHAIAGAPVEQTLRGPQGVQLATRMGTANATLAASDLWPEKHYGYAWQLTRTAKYAKRIGQRLPDAEPVLRRIMAKLEDIKPSGPPRPIHGAPHLHQWLVAGDQLGLVDFDRFGLGDPELDVATFLAEADFENNFAEIGRAYHTGFAREVALNRRLLWAYRLQKHIAKALRLLSAIRLDAEDHALHVLELAAYKAERLS